MARLQHQLQLSLAHTRRGGPEDRWYCHHSGCVIAAVGLLMVPQTYPGKKKVGVGGKGKERETSGIPGPWRDFMPVSDLSVPPVGSIPYLFTSSHEVVSNG